MSNCCYTIPLLDQTWPVQPSSHIHSILNIHVDTTLIPSKTNFSFLSPQFVYMPCPSHPSISDYPNNYRDIGNANYYTPHCVIFLCFFPMPHLSGSSTVLYYTLPAHYFQHKKLSVSSTCLYLFSNSQQKNVFEVHPVTVVAYACR